MDGDHELPFERIVGRTAEIEALLDLLPAARLVTVTGLGGTGKTRLAREVLRRWTASGRPGDLVALEAVADAEQVPLRVLDTLARDATSGDEDDAIARALDKGPFLLVLDNLEQVLAASPRIAGWLHRAPTACVLATSRVPLGVPGERRFPLGPLPGEDAAALFARELERQGGSPAGTDAEAISEVCRAVGGMPLALELSAARAALVGVHHILARMEPGASRPTALGEAVDWALSALSARDRDRAVGLAAVPGPFDAELLAAVWDADDPLPTLSALVEVSILRRIADAAGEFEMLVPVREVLSAGLSAPERDATLARCREFVMRLAADRGTGLPAIARRSNLIDAVLRWQEPDPDTAADTVWALDQRWSRAGLDRLALYWTRRLLALPGVSGQARARLLAIAAVAEEQVLGLVVAAETARLAIEAAVDEHLPDVEIDAQHTLARCLDGLGDADARAAYEDALRLARSLDDARRVMVIGGNLAGHHLRVGNLEAARTGIAATAEAARLSGDSFSEALALGNLALMLEGAEALAASRRSLDLLSAMGPSTFLAWSAMNHVNVLLSMDHTDEARTSMLRHLSLVNDHGGWAEHADALDNAAWIADQDDRCIDSVRLVGAADAVRGTAGAAMRGENRTIALRERLRERLGDATYDRHAATGASMPVDEVLAGLAAQLQRPSETPVEARYGRLSKREREVLALVAQGATDPDIAFALGMSAKTASVHVSNLKGKIGVETRIDLALAGRHLLDAAR